MNWEPPTGWYNINSHTGDLIPLVSNSNGHDVWYYNGEGSFKASMYNSESIIGKTLVIYERPDDFGLEETNNSQEWGSAGREIACCTIERFCEPEEPC